MIETKSIDADQQTENEEDPLRFRQAFDEFCVLLDLAEANLAENNITAAADIAQIAARFAFPGTVGVMGSRRLERILVDLGRLVASEPAAASRRERSHRLNVLHILSYGRRVGGDTRFAWRWIQNDSANLHSVALTSQDEVKHEEEIPELLLRSVEASGGSIYALNDSPSEPLKKAEKLRKICREMDVVVLHLFPYDVVPIIALAAGCQASVIFVNHSDHTFWLGGSIAHCVAHLRRQPANLLANRRGLTPESSSVLPIPLSPEHTFADRAEAKRALGYGSDTIVLLTIASPFKYSAPDAIGFLDLVTPIVSQHPEVVLIAVGPGPEGSWQVASTETGGRIVPFGTQWDNDLLYRAADIYLDSVPLSSITSLLEAGRNGVALLGYAPQHPDLALLGAAAPGLDHTMLLPDNPDSYQALLRRLITEAEFRREHAERVQSHILREHTGSRWLEYLNTVYADASKGKKRNRSATLLQGDEAFQATALNFALNRLYVSARIPRLIAHFTESLRYRTRVALTFSLYRAGFGLCWINLLPPPANTLLRKAGGRAKRSLNRLLPTRVLQYLLQC